MPWGAIKQDTTARLLWWSSTVHHCADFQGSGRHWGAPWYLLSSVLVPGYHSTNYCSLKWFGFSAVAFWKTSFLELPVMAAPVDIRGANSPVHQQQGSQSKIQHSLPWSLHTRLWGYAIIMWARSYGLLPTLSSLFHWMGKGGDKGGQKWDPDPRGTTTSQWGPAEVSRYHCCVLHSVKSITNAGVRKSWKWLLSTLRSQIWNILPHTYRFKRARLLQSQHHA